MAREFDFVVVGGGTAGCLLASRLAYNPSRPSVALVEGGPAIDKPAYRNTCERFTTFNDFLELDYGYKTAPQKESLGRRVLQRRGKGLGGSSAVNFQVWSLGARPEFDTWAERVGDKSWAFDNVLQKVKEIETLHVDKIDAKWAEYIRPNPKFHGTSGPVDVSIGPVEPETKFLFGAAEDLGHKRNLDPNGGDIIGFSLAPSTSLNGVRVTSASAFLEKTPVPDNLTLITDAFSVKILVEGGRAVGVVQSDGTQVLAKKEVIISAGAIDSPRLLLLSGIGPREDLEGLGIPVVNELPGVGKSFADHPGTVMSFKMKPGYTKRREMLLKYAEGKAKASQDLKEELYATVPHGFYKSEASYQSPEFQLLPKETQEYLTKPGVPNYEIVGAPALVPDEAYGDSSSGFCSLFAANMNSVSRGTIKLASSDPQDHPIIDPAYLGHPYDVVTLVHAVREAMHMMQTPTMKEFYAGLLVGPASDSDDDIRDYLRRTVAALNHPSSSVKMGRSKDDGSCVDSDLKVHGLKGLRVADLSVTPLLPSGHPQIVAYLIGQIAADKIAKEYSL
ncbi:GMC oxidoreductase [Niveomyces insectorum RCEF 264]|uniref:GMC oxidoreductase n=1 Tax=Niveomyces insectorum RCEF 264 TaxID=1081102 RepID=A0A167SIH1_9HYPO|nr:GMC oxidoreductase [Niveomyces insectorum RCEF 264]